MSLTPEEIAAVADALVIARAGGKPAPVPAASPSASSDAYLVQDAVASRLGPPAGWKVGARSQEAVPTCAPLLAGTVLAPEAKAETEAGGTIAVGTAPVGVELEVAYRLGPAFPAGRDLPGDDEILAAIQSAHVAVELCRTRFVDRASVPPLWLLADNQMNHLLVLGPAIRDWHGLESAPPVARLAVDGAPLVVGATGHPAGGTQRLLAWLVRHAIAERGGLPAGAVITTGSWTGLPWIDPPASIEGDLAGHGRLALRLSTDEPA